MPTVAQSSGSDVLYNVELVILKEMDTATGLAKAGGVVCNVTTGLEVELDPVISNGEEKVHRTDTQILAIARTPDLLYGYNFKFKDATFSPEVASLIEGAELVHDAVETTAIIGYDTPMLADGATFKKFLADVYVANYDGDSIVNYVQITLSNCTGKAPKLGFKKDFLAPEFEIKARENTLAGLPIKKVRYVSALPTV